MTCACLALMVLATLALTGCVRTKETGTAFDADARHRLVVNWTTRKEVEAMFGKPKTVTTGVDGEETWVYEHTRVWAVEYPIPARNAVSIGQTPQDLLTIRFVYGVMTGCSFQRQRYTTRDGRIVPAERTSDECVTRADAEKK